MKKNLFIILSLFAVSLGGCTTSDKQVTKIDSQEGEQLFNSQVEDFQYIKDLEDYLSYNILSLTEDKPFTSDFSFSAKFDENSSLQGGVNFSQKTISKAHNLESMDIDVDIIADKQEKGIEPFDLSGSVSILYKDDEMYANLHNLNVFMGEGNMVAKMYTLLGDLVIGNWIDLEVHSGGVVKIDEKENKKLPYIVGILKNVLKTEDIQSSPNFLGSVAELLETINSYIDLGISVNELTMVNHEISYFELSDKSIQKQFTGTFQGKESAFDLSFIASKKGLDFRLFNVREYNETVSDYENTDLEFLISLEEKDKSEYVVRFELTKLQQKIVDLQGEIKYLGNLEFWADFVMEPLELVAGQKLSGKLEGSIIKTSGESDREFPELTGEILSLSEILSSL